MFYINSKEKQSKQLCTRVGLNIFVQSLEAFSCKMGGIEVLETKDLAKVCFTALRNRCGKMQTRPTD